MLLAVRREGQGVHAERGGRAPSPREARQIEVQEEPLAHRGPEVCAAGVIGGPAAEHGLA
eukprot:14031862-Heterocapsa_arctica.AAC.1